MAAEARSRPPAYERDIFVAGPNHMETASGFYLNLLSPDPQWIRVADIAHHLAQINRYTGAARRPMSVAEHAILVADRLRSQGYGADVILRGLHHDDAEAFCGDVGRPLKLALGSAYGEIEARLDAAVVQALRLPKVDDWTAVKAADDWALAAEAYHLLPSRGRGWFCDGLYDPDDRRNPPAALRLIDRTGPSSATASRLFLAQHRRWRTLVDDMEAARRG